MEYFVPAFWVSVITYYLLLLINFLNMHAEPKKHHTWERKQSTIVPPVNITMHTFWKQGGLLLLIYAELAKPQE